MQIEAVADATVEELDTMMTTPMAPQLDKTLITQLIEQAQASGLGIDGDNGLLGQLTKLVVESALEGEITAHLGYEKHEKGASVDGQVAERIAGDGCDVAGRSRQCVGCGHWLNRGGNALRRRT